MITKNIKTTSGNLKITIPSDIKELTVGMLVDLTPVPGDSFSKLEQLSILSGTPLESDSDEIITLYDILNLDDLKVFDEHLQLLAYQIMGEKDNMNVPDNVVLEIPQSNIKRWYTGRIGRTHLGKQVRVAKNLGIEPAGAYMEAKELIKSEFVEYERIKKEFGDHIEFSPSINSMVRLLALYFYCPATGEKFNPVKVTEFQEIIKKMPMVKALPIARYFFLNYPNLSRQKEKH